MAEKYGTKLDSLYTSFIEPAREKESSAIESDSDSHYTYDMVAVTGVKAGTDTITITSGDITKTIAVNVVA